MKHLIRFVLMLCFSSLMLGCAMIKKVQESGLYQDPKIEFEDIQLTALSLDAVSLDLSLSVDNPNSLPISVAGVDYLIKINGKQLVAGQKNEALQVAASMKSPVSLPLSLKFKDLANIGKGLLSQDEMLYLAEASVRIDIPLLGVRTFNVSREGRFPIPKPPAIHVKNFKVERLGFFDADVTIDLEVDNSNGFSIDVTSLDYALDVSGARWVKGQLPKAIQLPAKGVQVVQVPINLRFADVGASLVSLLTSGEALTYQLSGLMNVDTSLPLLKNLSLPINYSGNMAGL